MSSLGRIIAGHNAKVIASKVKVEPKRPWGNCSCPKKTRMAGECPLGGECLAECIVYRASVTVQPRGVAVVEDAPVKTYLGLAEPEWKVRLGNHKQDFKTTSKKNATCLSTSSGISRRRGWWRTGTSPSPGPWLAEPNLTLQPLTAVVFASRKRA